ncbi:MAG TPA: DUF2254 domain-containing protein [Bacteroidia bacterium]|nr:DUF2254 domain-containing protein [Bacteroidia bacterium]
MKIFISRVANDLRVGFLIRPLVIALLIGAAGMYLSTLEENYPQIRNWIPTMLFPTTQDPAVAQLILSNIATAMMTVVSIVFAILLMTLTLASTQFSPRIIISFVRDRVTQQTLGIFLGTFLYCLGSLPAARNLPTAFCPVVTVFGAMVLAFLCVTWLLFFIIHISRAVSVTHLVDRIARETEDMIMQTLPEMRGASETVQKTVPPAHIDEVGTPVLSDKSGYILAMDNEKLFAIAKNNDITIHVVRRIGHFIPAGIPLLGISGKGKLTPELDRALKKAFDIGATRTLDEDIEFGILQIVDIGLKAVSAASNDPSTAINCIDQLSSILIRFAMHRAPQTEFYYPENTLRLSIPWLGFDRILESAFEQIRLYSQADVAVSLRLLRAFSDIASTLPDKESRKLLVEQGIRLVAGCSEKLAEEVLKEMHARLAALEKMA